ncbi:MAG: ABC transporter permease [Lachnospiraceae bacterium]|nr:ABC transporter permease [Lachnospiraceae bacterium]
MRKRKLDFNFILGIVLISFVLILVLVGLFYTPYDPNAMDITSKNLPPSLSHLFGTDYMGRDILSRVMEGAKTTFFIGIATVTIGAVIGILVGAVTGYYGGILDEILMRINDGIASFPSILLALVMVSILGTGKYNIILALGIIFIPSFARVVRSEFIAQKQLDYVRNAKLMGAGDLRIMFVHILPNTRSIILSAVTVGFNNAVLAEAGMSYLSLGVQPPDASLGRMLSEAQTYLFNAPWFALAPGLIIVITVLGFSLINERGMKDGN